MKYVIIILLCAFSYPVVAAEYSVTPMLIEHTVEPRDMSEETVKITNTSGRKLRIFPTVNQITLGEGGEIKSFVPPSMSDNTTSITSWISVTRGRVEINPGETIKIPLNITVNPNAVAGEYHAFIGFAEGSKRDEAEALVMEGRAPGVVVRLSLVEKKSEYLRLNRFVINRFVTNHADATVSYELENVGGLPITPSGEIIFYDSRGVEIAAVTVNDEKKSIQANNTEKFSQVLPDVGTIGKRKALLNIQYGTTQRSNLYDTTYFNVIPLVPLIAIFGVLLLLSVLLVLYYHKRANRPVNIDHEEVSVYIKQGTSTTKYDHDINLKK